MAGTRRLTLREASEELGVSIEAVRKRVKRESLESDKDPDGRVYVYLDAGGDTSRPQAEVESSELVEELRDRVAFLERELDRRHAEAMRYQEIVAGLSRTNAELSARLPELEATEAPETAEDASEGPEPRPEAPDAQEHDADTLREWTNDVERRRPQEDARRPWWRRVFGGR